jgi:outer membrane protein TolC
MDGWIKGIGVAAACLVLGACATYTRLDLPKAADLTPTPARLTADLSKLRLAPLKAHRFDPSDGLDPTEIAVLAVLNNPDLKAKRARAAVAAAQAFSAGLLPDPQVSVSVDFPVDPVNPTAYNVTPSLDLMALVTHSAALKSAKASATQADLDLLWSEWNIAQQARQLAVSALAGEQKAGVLKTLYDRLADRSAMSSAALDHGDLTAAIAGADLAAKLDAQAALATAKHDAAKARGDLNALLGLTLEVRLNLVPGTPVVDPDPAALDAAVAALPERRPDLLALKAGYAAQNANLRKAIIAQFPILNLGFSRASDTSAVVTNGVSATFVVPIFNRGRGEIAVQSATREQLRAEYQARLDQTVADAAAARREREAARALVNRLQSQVPKLMATAAEAGAPYRRGDIDSAAYLAIEQSALNHQVALLDQRLAFELAAISLETVLFLPSDLPSDLEAKP